MTDTGHWTPFRNQLGEDFNPMDFFGFVYRITRKDTGRSYIGKKQLIYTTRKKVAGRTNRKHVKKESDWKEYTGSCDELNQEITQLGKGDFSFEILKFCLTKQDLGYTETMYQFNEDVLDARMSDGTRKYYNSNIMNRWFVREKYED
jgi:hypothetical protein